MDNVFTETNNISISGGNLTANEIEKYNFTKQPFQDQLPADWLSILGQAVAIATMLFGVLGNSTTILAYRRSRKLQTSFNCLITNLCAMDLTFSSVIMPFCTYFVIDRNPPTRLLCSVAGFAFNVMMSSSVLNLVFIAVNRYVGIVHSPKYRLLFSRKLLKWWIIAPWCAAGLLYTPFLLTQSFIWREETLSCDLAIENDTNKSVVTYHVVILIVLQVLPMFILVTLYREILHKVKRCRKTMEHYPAPSPSSLGTTGGREYLKSIRRISAGSMTRDSSQVDQRRVSSPRDFANDTFLKVPGTPNFYSTLNRGRSNDEVQTPRHASSPNLQSHVRENPVRRKSCEEMSSTHSSNHDNEERNSFSSGNKIDFTILSTIESENKSAQSPESGVKLSTFVTSCSLKTDSSASTNEEPTETKSKNHILDQIKIEVPDFPTSNKNNIRNQPVTSPQSQHGHQLARRYKSAPARVIQDSESSLEFNKNEDFPFFHADLCQNSTPKTDNNKRGYSMKLRRKIPKKIARSNSVGGRPRLSRWSKKKRSEIRIVIDNPSSDGLGSGVMMKLHEENVAEEKEMPCTCCSPVKLFKRPEKGKKTVKRSTFEDKVSNGVKMRKKYQEHARDLSECDSSSPPGDLTKLTVYNDRRVSIGSRIYRYPSVDGDNQSRRGSCTSFNGEYRTTRTQLKDGSSLSFDRRLGQMQNSSGALHNFWTRRRSRRPSKCNSYTSSNGSSRRKRRRTTERHLTFSGIIICLALVVYTLPTSVIFALKGATRIYISPNITFAVSILPWLHVIINPLLYGFLNPQYRIEFRKMILDAKRRLKNSTI